MNWEERYRFRLLARTSLVLWSGVALVAALAAAPAARWLDGATGLAVLRFSPDGARAILGALSGSMLTFIVFVLSSLLIVVQLASAQLTPRVIAVVFAMPRVKLVLASLTFTYTYTLAALSRIDANVPELHVGIAILLNLACVIGFLLFAQQLSTGLRPAALMSEVGKTSRAVIAKLYPEPYAAAAVPKAGAAPQPTGAAVVVESTWPCGVVMAFGVREVVRLAREADAVIELVPQVGNFVASGDPLFRVYGGRRPVSADALRGCVAIGPERTLDQDPRFALRILVDIANKGLSPAINDPTTAVLALDQIHHLLLCLGRRRLRPGRVHDAGGTLRLVYHTPGWTDYVVLAVSEIRQYGAGSIQVDRRLRAMLDHLIATLPEARAAALRDELRMLDRAVQRGFRDEEDCKRAAVGDYQGVGASPHDGREPEG